MKTDDELISEFMGFTCDNDFGWYEGPRKEGVITAGFGNVFAFNVKDSQFHTSWDWLMPVVDKIMRISVNTEVRCWSYHLARFRTSLTHGNIYRDEMGDGETLHEATYKAVVEFIKWHNKQAK